MPTAPIWTGARLAAVGIAEGLGASMAPLYGRQRAAAKSRKAPHSASMTRGAICGRAIRDAGNPTLFPAAIRRLALRQRRPIDAELRSTADRAVASRQF